MNLYQKLQKKLQDVYYTSLPVLLPQSRLKVECPFCGWRGESFLPNGVEVRPNARCPKCNSLERHRLYYLYLKNVIPAGGKLKVLHFAPEKILTRLFTSYQNIDYLSADIDPSKAMVREDITRISRQDNSFDIIFCSHVLEHIPDDRLAMRELYRVLKPSGFAILQVPIKDIFHGRVIEQTYEDFSITTPEGREKAFGQNDHVRVYGRDFKDRIASVGFHVREEKFVESLPRELVNKYALLPSLPPVMETEGWIYYCTK
ncbi:MAG: methyltransferase domain-containing protein [Cyclobacteriaceae bacterium]